MDETERDLLIEEIVAYYKLYDFHDVWKPAGARALVEWLAARGYVLCASPDLRDAADRLGEALG